jgi:mono/diheme cytochrome c family protein
MGRRVRAGGFGVWAAVVVVSLALGVQSVQGEWPADALDSAAERGRLALTTTGYLKPSWGDGAYARAGQRWNGETPAPDAAAGPEAYAAAFNRRYGLNPAPFPNDGLPMGLRRGNGPDGAKTGIQLDCLVCHGGSIGGTSIVGLGNTTLDLKALLEEMTAADGQRLPPSTFTLTSVRGSVNAGQIAVVLLSFRNADLSPRRFPLPLGASYPECDIPPWWHMARKATMYYDGRTDARSVRSIMQFMLGEKTLEEFKELEPIFRDIHAYLKSLRPPRYPFAIDQARADRGQVLFEKTCAKCHGTYGPEGHYPNVIVELERIGTDPVRAQAGSDRLIAHYNATWLGAEYPVDPTMTGYQAPPLDGIWATAPYLHNGSVPTLALLLKSSDRPDRFTRPPSTDFAHYDQVNVGWKCETMDAPLPPGIPPTRARRVFDTAKVGLGNGGHTFGDKLSDDERRDVIEYLKTL